MITDLNKINRLSKKKEKENLKFRSYLKFAVNPKEIDRIVVKLFNEISSKIDCTQCANCCKKAGPVLTGDDIEKLSGFMKIEKYEFIKNYMKKDEDNDYLFKNLPCPLLNNNLCTCYSARPEECTSYPHLHKDDFIFRLYGVINNCSICPIVFNVFEKLKKITW